MQFLKSLVVRSLLGFAVLATVFGYGSSSIAGERGEITLSRAEKLILDAQTGNKQDLIQLWTYLQNQTDQSSSPPFEVLREKAIAKLISDQEGIAALQSALGAQGTWPWKSSLVKLSGTEKYTGILEDATHLLEKSHSLDGLHFDRLQPTENQITVLKTVLLYLAVATGTWDWDQQGKDLSLVYPIALPHFSENENLKTTALDISLISPDSLSSGLILNQPNAGFIFGGNILDGKLRGIDASALTSYAAGSSIRLSTWHMEQIWKRLKGQEHDDGAEIRQAAEEFQALDAEKTQDIQPGDFVFWRSPTSLFGHVVIFKKWVSDGSTDGSTPLFIGIQATRTDDKTKEGIFEEQMELFRPSLNTYILRRSE